jgi:hypothetical protein
VRAHVRAIQHARLVADEGTVGEGEVREDGGLRGRSRAGWAEDATF